MVPDLQTLTGVSQRIMEVSWRLFTSTTMMADAIERCYNTFMHPSFHHLFSFIILIFLIKKKKYKREEMVRREFEKAYLHAISTESNAYI
jgi:hypothetical protein